MVHNAVLLLPTARRLDATLVSPHPEMCLCAVVHKLSLQTVEQTQKLKSNMVINLKLRQEPVGAEYLQEVLLLFSV